MLSLRQLNCIRLDRLPLQASSPLLSQSTRVRAAQTVSYRSSRVLHSWNALHSNCSGFQRRVPPHANNWQRTDILPSPLLLHQSTRKPVAGREDRRSVSSKQSSKDERLQSAQLQVFVSKASFLRYSPKGCHVPWAVLKKEHESSLSTTTKSTGIINQTISHLQHTRPHENIYTVPNFLTVSRLIAAPVTGYLILHGQYAWATGLLFYAGVTDLVDGWIARKWKLQTVVGSIIDPLADKALMTILTVCLAVQGALPVWLATIILGRDVSLAIAAVYYRYASLPSPKTFARYWDFSLPSAEVHPTGISKANTLLQLLLIGAATALPVAGPSISVWLSSVNAAFNLDTLVAAAQYIVATTTVWSGASYLYTGRAVKILGTRDEASKKKILVRGKAVLGISFLASVAIALALESL